MESKLEVIYKPGLLYFPSRKKEESYDCVLAFDLNETLIEWKKFRFILSPDNWIFINNRIEKLINMNKKCLLVIITNQNYHNYKRDKIITFLSSILRKLRKLDLDFVLLASIENGKYKKPNREIWDFFLEHYPQTKDLEVIYVGDAAGRENDFSDSDLLFARNINAKFYTPEEFFEENG